MMTKLFHLIVLLLTLCQLTQPISALAGFAKTTSGGKAKVPSLSKEAQKLLKKHKGNVDAASDEYFGRKMKLEDQQNQVDVVMNDHSRRVAATWDTVAAFLPVDYKNQQQRNKKNKKGGIRLEFVEPYVDRRLDAILQACRGDDEKLNLLDVGCGDGSFFGKLSSNPKKSDEYDYVGMDISPEMIRLGKERFPTANLQVGCFPQDLETNDDNHYNTILFNGSLQFFPDTADTLAQAMGFLDTSGGGRIVLSHVEGSKFVQHECRTNPSVAVRRMPTQAQLKEWTEARWSDQYRVVVLTKEELLAGCQEQLHEDDQTNEEFYLFGLQVSPA